MMNREEKGEEGGIMSNQEEEGGIRMNKEEERGIRRKKVRRECGQSVERVW